MTAILGWYLPLPPLSWSYGVLVSPPDPILELWGTGLSSRPYPGAMSWSLLHTLSWSFELVSLPYSILELWGTVFLCSSKSGQLISGCGVPLCWGPDCMLALTLTLSSVRVSPNPSL